MEIRRRRGKHRRDGKYSERLQIPAKAFLSRTLGKLQHLPHLLFILRPASSELPDRAILETIAGLRTDAQTHTHTHTQINAGENILPRFRGDKNHSGVEPFGIAMPCGLNMIVFSPKFKHRSEHKHTVHLFLTVDSETDLLSEYASNVLGYTKVASGVAGVCSWDNQRPRVVDEVLVTRAEQVDDGVVLSPADDRAGIADDIARKNNVFASDRRQHAGSLLARPRRNCQRQHTSSFIHLFIYCKSKSKKVNNV